MKQNAKITSATAASHRRLRPNERRLDAELRALAEKLEIGLGKIMQPIRVAVTGGTVSEAVHDLLHVVGREESLRRIRDALSWEAES